MSENTMIQIREADKYYNRGRGNEIHVINHLNLDLPDKGMIAIFGRSGCGKTTLLNAIGGLDKIGSGSIFVKGYNIKGDTDYLRNKYIGYIFQNYNLNIHETVFDNVANALRLCGMTDKNEIHTRVMASLSNVEMDKFKNRTPDTLSGGQQQRVAIARALVKNPAIILADEPTGNLDENNTVLVMDILKEISKEHLVLLVTHEANLVDYYCDKVIELVDGQVVGIKENTGANGYVQRNKNDIYLGELEKSENQTGPVTLTCYGNPDHPIQLRLITSGGKTYLVCDTPGVKLLDESSEIHLKEGTFEEINPVERASNGHTLNMSALAPFEGKNYGKLYHFGNALKSAWIENFAHKQKRGKRMLRACMVLLSIVLVFVTAATTINLKTFFATRENHNGHLLYLPLEADKDYSALTQHVGENGIDYIRLIGGDPETAYDEITFKTASFVTAQATTVTANGCYVDIKLAKDLTLVAGSATLASDTDIIITTALADKLLDNSTVAYLNEYADLIGLISSKTNVNGAYYRLSGIVESDECLCFMASELLADTILEQCGGMYNLSLVTASSQSLWDQPLARGEVISYLQTYTEEGNTKEAYHVGDTITLFGNTYTVVATPTDYYSLSQYPDYMQDKHNIKLLTYKEYLAQERTKYTTETMPSDELLEWQYVFDYLLGTGEQNQLAEYSKWIWDTHNIYSLADYTNSWYCAQTDGMVAWLYYFNYIYTSLLKTTESGKAETLDIYTLWWVYNYRTLHNGSYPADLEALELAVFNTETSDYNTGYSDIDESYPKYVENHQTEYNKALKLSESRSYTPDIIINDEDYLSLASSAGKSDEVLQVTAFYHETWSDKYEYYSNYMLIHANNPTQATAYLEQQFGDDVVTANEALSASLSDNLGSFVGSAVTVLVLLVLMCLCIYFIMRSAFMSRVKEVGILRAIGVSKSNLKFRFFVEALLLTTMTAFVGFILSTLVILYLSGAPLFSEVFFFPPWMAISMLIVIYGASLLFGVLPASALLRKTPSEILAKYDI